MSLKQWEPARLIEGLAGEIGFPPTPADAHRRGQNKINLCEKDSWQWLEEKYKTLEKFIYRIFTETGTSSAKKKNLKKGATKRDERAPGQARLLTVVVRQLRCMQVRVQHWYVQSLKCPKAPLRQEGLAFLRAKPGFRLEGSQCTSSNFF